MERVDDLQFHNLRILQDPALACFTEDAVLLANFLTLRPGDEAVDLGAGNGILSILGAAKTGARFCGVERQSPLVDLARRSAEMNGQDIPFYLMDVADAPAALGRGRFSAAVSNPPYFVSGVPAKNDSRAAARHGAPDTLEAFLSAAFLLLKNGGRLFTVCPASQLARTLTLLTQNRLEPKRMQLVAKSVAAPPRLALIEAKKLAKPGVVWLPTIVF